MDTRREKTVNRDSMQGEASLSDVSSTRSTSSPGRARRVSMKMKLKKGLKGVKEGVKEILSPHHHHHHHSDGGDGEERQERRKPGPNESRRGPLAPVLDHLERNNSVPIHLHISHAGSFSISRKASSSSYTCSDLANEESKTSADIHQHIQAEQPQQSQQEQQSSEAEPEPEPQQPEPQPAMDVPETYVVPPSPRRSDYGEETPNPFLVDDPEDPLSDPGSSPPAPILPLDPGSLLPETSPSESVTLSPGPSSEPPLLAEPAPQVPAVDKPVPALPVASDTESEQEAPAVHLPQLVMPTMFLPIPNTDPLTTLLTKYISNPERRPQRDLTGEWTKTDFHTLIMTNSWRALARMARDRIVQADPEDLTLVLNLWSLRLSSLARLRLFNQASAEATNLSNALGSISPPTARTHVLEQILPFELDVIYARVKYWAGDAQGYTDALGSLLRRCRRRARIARLDADRQMWIERAARVGLIAASQFIEIKDYTAATALLEPLATQQQQESKSNNNSELRSALGRVYLQAGQLDQAEVHFAAVAADADADANTTDTGTDDAAAAAAAAGGKTLNAAFLASARGDWDMAGKLLRGLVEQDEANYAAVNNLAVALLGQGKLKEGIEVLETALESSPSTLAMAEPFLFNLSTLYELRSSIAADKKRDLLIEVAKWCGDGLRTSCLKMPT